MGSGLMGVDRECGIQSVRSKTKTKDKRVLRGIVFVLTHELDDDIARGIGDEAVAVLDGIRSGAIKKAELDISAVKAFAQFTAPLVGEPSKLSIDIVVGIKAVCAPATKEDDPPSIAMAFELAWDKEAWAFLGRRLASTATVVFTKAQGELDFGEGDPAPGASGAASGESDGEPESALRPAARAPSRPKLRGITGGGKGGGKKGRSRK